jgi:hypothetical protein
MPSALALARFLAGYSGMTRDLRQYTSWCQHPQLRLFAAHRAGIECFALGLEAHGRATITRRLCIAGSTTTPSRKHSSTTQPLRMPADRLDYESHVIGLDRNELGALLVVAGLGPAADHAKVR